MLNMNERYTNLNSKIMDLKMRGVEDDNILKCLFSAVNLKENEMVDRNIDLKNETDYSHLSSQDLIFMYDKEIFNKLNSRNILHLTQEVHNRYMKERGVDVTRNVVVQSDKELDGVYGYVCGEDDLLFINKYMIDKTKFTSPQFSNFNMNNVGLSLLYILLHESTHVVQFENAISLALDEKLDMEQAFSGAVSLINDANFFIAESISDYYYPQIWQMQYDYHYMEQEANFTALIKEENMVNASKKNSEDYIQYLLDATVLGLRFIPNENKSNDAKIQRRVEQIERYLESQLNYFNLHTGNGPIKEKVMKVMETFMEVDEKGNSMLRSKLEKEINFMVNIYLESKKELKLIHKYDEEDEIDVDDDSYDIDDDEMCDDSIINARL